MTFEEIMAESFPKLMRNSNPQIQEAQQTQSTKNQSIKQTTLLGTTHLSLSKIKEKIFFKCFLIEREREGERRRKKEREHKSGGGANGERIQSRLRSVNSASHAGALKIKEILKALREKG